MSSIIVTANRPALRVIRSKRGLLKAGLIALLAAIVVTTLPSRAGAPGPAQARVASAAVAVTTMSAR